MAGKVHAFSDSPPTFRPEVEHLGCFAGGMLALGGRLLDNSTHVQIGRRLTEGYIWAYNTQLGIMPEDFTTVAALSDVTDPTAPKMHEMESFWLGEILKYFYLIFSEPDLISLDEYVLNTEAHPLRIPQRRLWGWT